MSNPDGTRRDFLALATALCSTALAAPQGMKLSLSVRVAEAFDNKEKATLTIDEIIAMAKKWSETGVMIAIYREIAEIAEHEVSDPA